jgi:hypothetical protein
MFHDVAIIPTVNMLLFFLAGMTVGLNRQSRRLVALAKDART